MTTNNVKVLSSNQTDYFLAHQQQCLASIQIPVLMIQKPTCLEKGLQPPQI
jgi:hypothetical protein